MSRPDPSVSAFSSEAILGQIPVRAQLKLGTERLRLFVTDHRLILAHVGKRGAAALATTSLLGRLSGALEDLLKGGRESLKKRKIEASSPQEILEADKDNFPIGYNDIVRLELHPANDLVRITIFTKEEKLEFVTLTDFEKLLGLFTGVIRGKVSVETI